MHSHILYFAGFKTTHTFFRFWRRILSKTTSARWRRNTLLEHCIAHVMKREKLLSPLILIILIPHIFTIASSPTTPDRNSTDYKRGYQLGLSLAKNCIFHTVLNGSSLFKEGFFVAYEQMNITKCQGQG